jgi:L-alanine-DL-glutamate epimerase-like enolase superfamily enzyme
LPRASAFSKRRTTNCSPRFDKGFYYPTNAPGFGIEINEGLLKKYTHD